MHSLVQLRSVRRASPDDAASERSFGEARSISPGGADAFAVLEALRDMLASGEPACLVTLVGITGRASRRVGTQMAVAADGRYAGSLSGGCVEAAVLAEARKAIGEGTARVVRFGVGSPYIDIRLPCGGGLDLLFQPDPPFEPIARAVKALKARRAVQLRLGPDQDIRVRSCPREPAFEPAPGSTLVTHAPRLRLLALGHGDEIVALTALARAFGADVVALSPDELRLTSAATLSADIERLVSASARPRIEPDPWTAVALLFHDHDWEPSLLEWALASDAFFVGAMGSRRAHERRIAALRERGVPQAAIDRIVSPLGSAPGSRDPATLAISALAQIVEHFETQRRS